MRKRIVISGVLLIIGIIIYLIFNQGILDKSNAITAFVRNFIPDMLWSMSFYFFTISISRDTFKHYKTFNSLYVITIGLIFELLQLFKIVNGTFDVLDIIVYVFSVLLASLIEIFIRRMEDEKR